MTQENTVSDEHLDLKSIIATTFWVVIMIAPFFGIIGRLIYHFDLLSFGAMLILLISWYASYRLRKHYALCSALLLVGFVVVFSSWFFVSLNHNEVIINKAERTTSFSETFPSVLGAAIPVWGNLFFFPAYWKVGSSYTNGHISDDLQLIAETSDDIPLRCYAFVSAMEFDQSDEAGSFLLNLVLGSDDPIATFQSELDEATRAAVRQAVSETTSEDSRNTITFNFAFSKAMEPFMEGRHLRWTSNAEVAADCSLQLG